MHRAATNSLIFTDLSSLLSPTSNNGQVGASGLYQLVIQAAQSESLLRSIGTTLVAVLEQAYAYRQIDLLEATSNTLLNMPVSRDLESIGRYYKALCLHRSGRGDLEQAVRLLENTADQAPAGYRARALISLGAKSIARGDYRGAIAFNREALGFIRHGGLTDYASFVRVQNEISLIASLDGNHVEALTIMRGTLPIANAVRTIHPQLYFLYLNNLAAQLNENGLVDEATYACNLALASPFAHAYPEWHETRDEIETRKRSVASRASVGVGWQKITEFNYKNNAARSTERQQLQVSEDQLPNSWPQAHTARADSNLLHMPAPERRHYANAPTESSARGRVLEFAARTRSLVEENGEYELEGSESRRTTADKLYEMLLAAIDDLVEFDLDLVESLYQDYLVKRMNA